LKHDPDRHHRRSIRLKGYDYTAPGAYFVTICTQNYELLFGNVVDKIMHLNPPGQMVEAEWKALPARFPHIEMDAFVVMPNHFHAILKIRERYQVPDDVIARQVPTLGDMVGSFKSITTDCYIRGVYNAGWLPFDRRVWQRNYWEHIIRDQETLERIRAYIQNNPATWEEDQLHPDAPPNEFKPQRAHHGPQHT
jgi:REP element-mobilizing transposase RayT